MKVLLLVLGVSMVPMVVSCWGEDKGDQEEGSEILDAQAGAGKPQAATGPSTQTGVGNGTVPPPTTPAQFGPAPCAQLACRETMLKRYVKPDGSITSENTGICICGSTMRARAFGLIEQ